MSNPASMAKKESYEHDLATAILGVDTLWGGDVMNPSGTGRFIADCWFSDEPLPPAYHDQLAASLRASGGMAAKEPDAATVQAYVARFDLRGTLRRAGEAASRFEAGRRSYVAALIDSLGLMLDLADEKLDMGQPVPYERCVVASTGRKPMLLDAGEERAAVTEDLGRLGIKVAAGAAGLLEAVDAWRRTCLVTSAALAEVSTRLVRDYDALVERHVVPHLPAELRRIPRANVKFIPIEGAWFSGSMNYLGRARTAEGVPLYEAEYEINAALEISLPEFAQLVSHEVVPGHVTTFALLQELHRLGRLGFEATIQTMNSRGATLAEGIANAGVFMAHGVSSIEELPTPELRLGVRLALLQDRAKNNASWMTWAEQRPVEEVAQALRETCLVSVERAQKLAGSWAPHPLMGRMYMPCYQVGTDLVLELLRRHGPARTIPVLYGVHGLVDCVTARDVLESGQR